eukprot:COSAG02_NODE_15393_length_1175_cov_0.910781_3_plen_29_part_01
MYDYDCTCFFPSSNDSLGRFGVSFANRST